MPPIYTSHTTTMAVDMGGPNGTADVEPNGGVGSKKGAFAILVDSAILTSYSLDGADNKYPISACSLDSRLLAQAC
jgi:hypothetical protein